MYRNTPENVHFPRALLQKQSLMLISILLHVLMKKYVIFKYEFFNPFVSELPIMRKTNLETLHVTG